MLARVERAAPWICGAALALPVIAFRYPPMGDLPMHEALVAILRHVHDDRWTGGIYFAVVPQANQLFHIAAGAIAFVTATDTACKIVVALTILATIVLAARWLARIGAPRWAALLVAPMACGWMFRWGLAPNLVGLAALVGALPVLEDIARRPTSRTVWRALGATALLFVAHESAALLFAIAVATFTAIRPFDPRRTLARATPIALVGGLVIAQSIASRALAGATIRAIGTSYGLSPMARVPILPGAIFGGQDELRIAALTAASVVAFAAIASGASRRRSRSRSVARVRAWRARYAIFAAVCLVLYLVFPMAVGGATLLAHRFLPGAWLGALAACAIGRRLDRTRVIAIAIVPLAVLVTEWDAFRESDQRFRDLDPIVARIPEGVAIAQLDLSPPGGPAHAAPIPPAASRALAMRGGRMLFAMTDMPPNPIYVRPAMRWNEPMRRLSRAPFAFSPAHDGARFAYLIALNGDDRFREVVRAALAPEEELVATSGPWDLYRSKRLVAAIDSPDEPLPDPPPETIADRINRRRPERPAPAP